MKIEKIENEAKNMTIRELLENVYVFSKSILQAQYEFLKSENDRLNIEIENQKKSK